MKKILLSLLLIILFNIYSFAQGLFGFGTQKLSKKKIEKIEIVLDESEKISPSSIIDVEMIAYDKKLKEFKTSDLKDGDYSINYNYKIEVDNGYYDQESQKIIIKKVNELTSNDVKIKVSLIDTELSIEKVIKINYLGNAVADFRGRNGRDGTSGTTKYLVFDGSNGQNGGSNSENGLYGKDITAFAKLVKLGNDEFIRLIVTYNNDLFYYSVNKLSGKILIDVSGGSGGDGGNAANGTSGDTAKFINGGKGGDGGNGANGGDAGSISIKFDNNMKGFENLISFSFNGGFYGSSGSGGSGGDGYQKGIGGRRGLDGLHGRGGQPPKISYEEVDFKWYD